jgi:hypothetical protein
LSRAGPGVWFWTEQQGQELLGAITNVCEALGLEIHLSAGVDPERCHDIFPFERHLSAEGEVKSNTSTENVGLGLPASFHQDLWCD